MPPWVAIGTLLLAQKCRFLFRGVVLYVCVCVCVCVGVRVCVCVYMVKAYTYIYDSREIRDGGCRGGGGIIRQGRDRGRAITIRRNTLMKRVQQQHHSRRVLLHAGCSPSVPFFVNMRFPYQMAIRYDIVSPSDEVTTESATARRGRRKVYPGANAVNEENPGGGGRFIQS